MLSVLLYAALSLVALNVLAVVVIARLGRRLSSTDARLDAGIVDRGVPESNDVTAAPDEAERSLATPIP